MVPNDSQQPPDSFRESYYSVVYRHAFKVTGSDRAAKKLADRVFRELERRYANNPINGHIDAFLAAQVYLSYAQKGLDEYDEGIPYESALPDAQRLPLMGNPSEAPPAGPVDQPAYFPPPQAAPPPPQRESMPYQNVMTEAVPTIKAPAFTQPPRAAAVRAGVPEPPEVFAAASQGTKYYDKNSTIFWTPGSETVLPSKEEPAEEYPAFEFPKPPLKRRSTLFNVLNGLLALCCVAAIVFLLVELNILPRLF